MNGRCAGLGCRLGEVTGLGCSGNARCALDVLAERGDITFAVALAAIRPPKRPWFTSPWGELSEKLAELQAPGATIKGTPMVPIHKDTLDEIIYQLRAAHRETEGG